MTSLVAGRPDKLSRSAHACTWGGQVERRKSRSGHRSGGMGNHFVVVS